MILSIFSDFLNYLNDKFSGSIPNLIFFAIGLGIGIILFLLIILIIALLSRPKKKIKQKIIEKNIVIKDEYKGVVQSNKDVFIHVYKSLPIKEKMTGMGKIILDMMTNGSLYVFDINSVTYLVDQVTGEITEYPFEEMDPYQEYEYFESDNKYMFIISKNNQGKISKKEALKNILQNK